MVVRAITDRWSDVTTFSCTNGFDVLYSMWGSFHYAHETRMVIVICSIPNVFTIFKAIRDRNLESPSTRWFVILRKDVTSDLASLVREGTLASVALRLSRVSYQFFTSFVNKENEVRLQAIGTWHWHRERGVTSLLQAPLTPDLTSSYADFGGRQLRGAVVDNWPFFRVTPLRARDGALREAAPHSGIDCNVLEALARKLNFTYKLLLLTAGAASTPTAPPRGCWDGGEEGRRVRHQIDFMISESRETVIDFTSPYFLESTTVLTPAPKEVGRAGAVFAPFTPMVWAGLIVSTLLIGPVLAGVSCLMGFYLRERPECSIRTYAFHMFRNLKATSGIYKEIWERFQPENGYVYTGDEGVEKVLTGKYAYLGGRLASEVRMTIFGQEQYHLARQTFQPQAYGVMLNSGSPYKGVFDKALLQLVESGLVGKWTRDESAFFLLATVLLLAALALLAEWAFARRGRGRRQTAQASVNPSVK
ncbi:hypothetical protein C7M84_021910 [Penaeus vannamei]|uniref:Ionotropic glutamate receptor C-terminal domain-containing protein n=1 Tax=Penaeus vannamei TaxID=6689 RepID=A0A3R7T122_PENVA|nr:hypothetical protein C7M84_021910 [Penaeus vannamei]